MKCTLAVYMLIVATEAKQLRSISEVVQERPNLMQLMTDVNQWDNEILGLIDNSYTRETAFSDSEQKVDIEFKLTAEE